MKIQHKLTLVAALILIGLLLFLTGRGQEPTSTPGPLARGSSTPLPPQAAASAALDPVLPAAERDPVSAGKASADECRYRYFLVLAEDTDQPIAGARASVDLEVANDSIASSNRGLLRLPAPLNGARIWYLKAPGFGLTPILDSAGGDQSEQAVPVRMRGASMLSVRVLDASGKPLTAATVELAISIQASLGTPASEADLEEAYNGGPHKFKLIRSGIGEVYHGQTLLQKRTDSNGECAWDELPAAVELRGVVAHAGLVVLRPASFTLAPRERRRIEWALPAKGQCFVRVIDASSRPLAGVWMRAVPADDESLQCNQNQDSAMLAAHAAKAIDVITDAAGVAVFTNLDVGTWYVGPLLGRRAESVPAQAPRVCAMAQRVAVTREPQEWTQVLADAQELAGIVIDAQGTPIAAASLSLFALGVCGSLEATTDEGGLFHFGPIPSGDYSLRTQLPNRTLLPWQAVRAGDMAVVVQAPILADLRIVAVDSDTGRWEPIQSVELIQGNGFAQLSMSGSGETFVAKELPSGQYNVLVRTRSHKAGFVLRHSVEASTAGELLRVPVSASSAVRIVNDHEVAAGFRLLAGTELVSMFSVVAKGSLVEELPSGQFQLECLIDKLPASARALRLASGSHLTMSWP